MFYFIKNKALDDYTKFVHNNRSRFCGVFIIRILSYVALIQLIVFSSCNEVNQSSTLDNILDSGVLKVGTTYGLTTYYNGPTGPVGFEYELVEGFADYLGVKLEVFPYYNLHELFPQLSDSHIDVIAAGLIVTPERFNSYKFGPSYQRVVKN